MRIEREDWCKVMWNNKVYQKCNTITHQEFETSQEFENVNFPSRFLSTVYEISFEGV